jgi:hypothetical protein
MTLLILQLSSKILLLKENFPDHLIGTGPPLTEYTSSSQEGQLHEGRSPAIFSGLPLSRPKVAFTRVRVATLRQ